MTDVALVLKKLARIEQCVAELKLVDLDRISEDVVVQRFVEHTLQVAAQSAIDAASHIVSDEHLGEPRTNAELFSLLSRHGWISTELATRLARMAGFRNLLVHAYDDVDLSIVEEVARVHVADLLDLAVVLRAALR